MKRILVIPIFCLFSTALSTSADDASVKEAAAEQLEQFAPTAAIDASLSVEEGILTLDGTAESLPVKVLATEALSSVVGVRGIINRLRIQEIERPDKLIQYDLKKRFDLQYPVQDDPIESKVNDGVVTLTGNVSTYELSQLAQAAAESVIGVRAVVNLLRVEPLTPATDAEIEQHLSLLLQTDPWIRQEHVSMTVEDGVVTLTGAVDTVSELARLRDTAQLYGVRKVDAGGVKIDPDLQIEWKRPHEPIFRSDEEIRKSIELVFQKDARINETNITVEVLDGEATLIGSVESIGAKASAEQDVVNTPGVDRLYSFLAVESELKVSDLDLENALETLFQADSLLGDSSIQASVDEGKVTLEGEVETVYQRRRAMKMAAFASGVKRVISALRVDWDTSPMTEEAADAVSKAD